MFSKKRRFTSRKSKKYKNKVRSGQSMVEYEERNIILLEMGFKDYRAYLRSPLWKEIRSKQLTTEPECFGCGRDASTAQMQIHHSRYSQANLTGISNEHLVTLCSRCHKWIEITKGGFKRNLEQANKVLFAVRKQYLCMASKYKEGKYEI